MLDTCNGFRRLFILVIEKLYNKRVGWFWFFFISSPLGKSRLCLNFVDITKWNFPASGMPRCQRPRCAGSLGYLLTWGLFAMSSQVRMPVRIPTSQELEKVKKAVAAIGEDLGAVVSWCFMLSVSFVGRSLAVTCDWERKNIQTWPTWSCGLIWEGQPIRLASSCLSLCGESRAGWHNVSFFCSICVVLVQMQLQLPKKSQQQRKNRQLHQQQKNQQFQLQLQKRHRRTNVMAILH